MEYFGGFDEQNLIIFGPEEILSNLLLNVKQAKTKELFTIDISSYNEKQINLLSRRVNLMNEEILTH